MTDELTAWFTQVLDKEEALFQAAVDDDQGQDGGFEDAFDRLSGGREYAGSLACEPRFGRPAAAMIVHNTPRSRLADVAAKRAVLARLVELKAERQERLDDYSAWLAGQHQPTPTWKFGDREIAEIPGLEYAVRCMATAYSDRSGYHEGWRP